MNRIAGDEAVEVTFELNGQTVTGRAEPRMHLVDFLREVVGARGTHVGCEHGVCGACTVRIDGELARACLVFAVQVRDARVTTVEGLGKPDRLSALQAAFRKHHALQCGYCIPGILVSLEAMLESEPHPDEARVREVLSGHLCRCTGYSNMVSATLEAAGELRARTKENAP